MENQYLLKNNSQYNIKYKKLKNNHSLNKVQRTKKPNRDISAYDEIISRAKNTIDIFQKQLELTIPSIINYESNINNIKNSKSFRNQPQNNKRDQKSVRVFSGSSLYYQPILAEIANQSKEKIQNQNINDNTDEYYKILYQKSKNENIVLINRINELEKININNERIIIEYKNEKKFLLDKIQELENILSDYENQNNNSKNFLENLNEKNDINNNELIMITNERNIIMQENENLKNEINKILQENTNLKIKIKSIEKINNNINSNKNKIINNHKNHSQNSRINNNEDNPVYNKSYRVISNLSLYNNSYVKKKIEQKPKKDINRTDPNVRVIKTVDNGVLDNDNYKENIEILENENKILSKNNIELSKENTELKDRINELMSNHQLQEDNKDSYINDLEEEQKQNQVVLVEIKEENNNLLNQIDELKKEINNINDNTKNEISRLNIEIESLIKEKEILKKII